MSKKLSIQFFIVLLFLLCYSPKTKAQLLELNVRPEIADGPIPVFRDFPGQVGIIVYSSLTNLRFDSNFEIIDERSEPNEGLYRIIVEPQNQYVSISAPGFMTERIHLRGLSPFDVLYYSVEPVSQLHQTGDIVELTFADIKQAAVEFFEAEEYYFALDRFTDALRLRPDNSRATRFKLAAEDEIAWRDARILDTIEAYESYILGNTAKRYAQEAQEAMMRKHISLGEQHVEANNIEMAETILNKYIIDYPGAPDIQHARNLLCELYERNGDLHVRNMNLEGQRSAFAFYSSAIEICPFSESLNIKVSDSEKYYHRYRQPRVTYTNFSHDRISSYGITFGAANHFSRGSYFSLRFNERLFTSSSDYTVDSAGNVTGNITGELIHTGIEDRGNVEALIGLTYPIVYPLWVYAGAGYSYNPFYWRMDRRNSQGSLIETEWVRNTDESYRGAIFETGLTVNVVGLSFSLGMKGTSTSNLIPTVGIGFVNSSNN